eukprot:COSAG01_NODE_1117_length_11634_cov_26.813611_7_plen_193_part_00
MPQHGGGLQHTPSSTSSARASALLEWWAQPGRGNQARGNQLIAPGPARVRVELRPMCSSSRAQQQAGRATSVPPGLDPGKPTDKKVGASPHFRFLLTVTGISPLILNLPVLFMSFFSSYWILLILLISRLQAEWVGNFLRARSAHRCSHSTQHSCAVWCSPADDSCCARPWPTHQHSAAAATALATSYLSSS